MTLWETFLAYYKKEYLLAFLCGMILMAIIQ